MYDEGWGYAAKVFFFIGFIPVTAIGVIRSWFAPGPGLLSMNMSVPQFAEVALGVIAGGIVGALLASPFWLIATIQERRTSKRAL